MTKPLTAAFTYGGGLRGIIPATIMAAIETRTKLPLSSLFDVFSGPSSGSILNSAITRRNRRNPQKPQYSAQQMIYFYEREGRNIFPIDRYRAVRGLIRDMNNRFVRLPFLDKWIELSHYNERALARCLYALYGDARMGDSLTTLAIPYYAISPATGQSGLAAGGAQWFLNLKDGHGSALHPETPDVTLYDAVMASTAAPTYFPAHSFTSFDPLHQNWQTFQGIDGSVFDSPAITYQALLRPMLKPEQDMIYVAFGTGQTNPAIDKKEWDKMGALGLVDPANGYPLINVLTNAPDSALMPILQKDLGENLFIFNRPLYGRGEDVPSAAIDDATPENLLCLKNFGLEIVEDNNARIDILCQRLVSIYDVKRNA